MKKLFSRFTGLELLIGVIGIFMIVGIGIFGYSIYLYQAIVENKETGVGQAEVAALENSPLTEIETVSRYHGSDLYYIAEGLNEEGEETIVFVPESESENLDISSFLLQDLVSEEQVLSTWNSQCNECELIKYNWAMENGTPLMEVTYISQNDRYVLEYYSLEDGETYQRLPLERSLY